MEDKKEQPDTTDFFKRLGEAMEYAKKNIVMETEIEYPLEVTAVTNHRARPKESEKIGAWVSVRPVKEVYDGKTFLGIYLGDLTLESLVSYDKLKKELMVTPHTNPAIWVPDLNEIIWGCGSWWGIIKSPDELRKITDVDIENIWYVKALKELSAAGEETPA